MHALGPDSNVLDCGANVGTITRRLAAGGATVHAFEPDPVAYRCLQDAVSDFANVHLHHAAVGTENGRAKLYRTVDFATNPVQLSQSSSLFASKRNMDTRSSIEVDQVDLALFVLAQPKHIDILKMDIEGAEVGVLDRMLDTGAIARVRHLFVETHEKQMPELGPFLDALRIRLAAAPAAVNLDWT